MNTRKFQSEQVGEAFAHQVLSEHFGAEVFIGSSVEMKLQELAYVIYQDVPDLAYYGATVHYNSGQIFVAINTNHSLRVRYFTAAHELWHILGIKDMMDKELDRQRAADRFAAALMMPGALIRLLWGKLKNSEPKKAVIMIADMASAPYVATARRIKELNLTLSAEVLKITEEEWIYLRNDYMFTESPLDRSFPLVRFDKYETVIEQAVKQNKLELFDAGTKLSQVSPLKAQKHQQVAIEKLLSTHHEEETN